MFRFLALFAIIGTTLMGSGVVVALSTGYDTVNPVMISALIGLAVSLPVTWIVNRNIH